MGLEMFPKSKARLAWTYLDLLQRGFAFNYEEVKVCILRLLMLDDDMQASFGLAKETLSSFPAISQWADCLGMVEAIKREMLLVMRV